MLQVTLKTFRGIQLSATEGLWYVARLNALIFFPLGSQNFLLDFSSAESMLCCTEIDAGVSTKNQAFLKMFFKATVCIPCLMRCVLWITIKSVFSFKMEGAMFTERLEV